MVLQVRNLDVHYGSAQVLHGVSLTVAGTAPLAVIGRNGMGKTTLCNAIMGLVHASGGELRLDGERTARASACRVARSGIAIVPQGRRVFHSLTVDEHLKLVGRRQAGVGVRWTIERAYDTFPRLAERRRNAGSQLSGGEQQMLAIARALLMNPRLVVMDEPSEGLAPVIVDQLVGVLRGLAADGIALLLFEQNLRVATAVAESVAVMVNGRIAATLPAARLLDDEALQSSYLGIARTHHPP